MLVGNSYPVFGKPLAYMAYFILGCILRETIKFQTLTNRRLLTYSAVSSIIFCVFLLIKFFSPEESQYKYMTWLILGFSGSMIVLGFSRILDNIMSLQLVRIVLINIGLYSMTIYLLHGIFVSGVRITCYQLLENYNFYFEIVAFLAIISGIAFPLYLERNMLLKFEFTKRYILGLT
jgi:peptidoglycan/LPS O-acetylase OafA/YrhL